jgi:WD40 repeat protein
LFWKAIAMTSADPTKFKVTKTVRSKGIALCIANLPGTQRLFVGSSDFKVYEINLAAEKPESIEFTGEGHQSYVTGATIAGTQLVTGSYDGKLIWWDTEKREPVRAVPAHQKWIRNVVSSPDGKVIASVADDMLCKLWNAATGELLHTLVEHKPMTPHHFPSMLYACAFSADGKYLATGDKVGHMAVWDVATGQKLSELEAPVMYTWDPKQRRHSIGGIRSLAFSQDGKLLAAGGVGTIGNIDHLDGPSRIEIFDWAARQRVHEISDTKFKGLVEQIAFPREGSWFVGAGGDNGGFASFYDSQTGKVVHQDKMPMHVHKFVLNDAQDTLFAAGHDQIAVLEFKAVPPAETPAAPAS